MKRILIQNKSRTSATLDSLKDLVQGDFEGRLEIEATMCLSETELEITKYGLIICHPHIQPNSCCVPYFFKARASNVPVIFTYVVKTEETETLEAMSDQFKIDLKHQSSLGHQFYTDLIKSLEGQF
ncbi:MAG: hypothetical protein AABX76_01145 [Nanoarchaeota archaeon]